MSLGEKKPRLHLVDGRPEAEPEGLGAAVRAARGGDIDPTDHETLLALALGDDVAEVGRDELRAAEALARAVDARGVHAFGGLCGALIAAHRAAREECGLNVRAGELDPADHDALLLLALGSDAGVAAGVGVAAGAGEAATDRPPPEEEFAALCAALRAAARPRDIDRLGLERAVRRAVKDRRPSTVPVLGAIVAIAAGLALFVSQAPSLRRDAALPAAPEAAQVAALIAARSTEELFDPAERFPVKGGESDRLGKIVAARAADLRANRFAAWGVK